LTFHNQRHHHHRRRRRRRLSRIRRLGLFGSEFIFWNLWIYWTIGRTPWTGDRPDARPLPAHRVTQHTKTRTRIHASSGIRTHDPSVRLAEDRTCRRPLVHWDQLHNVSTPE